VVRFQASKMPELDDGLQIRVLKALSEGRPEDVVALLGRYWSVRAPVEHGDARGRTMGFPTANMHLEDESFLAFGIYAVRVHILEQDSVVATHSGVANFGIRPMYRITKPLLEAHLFDFDGDLYGKYLSVDLIAWLRPEAKFSGLDALIAQIAEDAKRAREILQQVSAVVAG
jgi:riboflavin kinase / FMN adenylyltransferase